jgi:hypothetical protein
MFAGDYLYIANFYIYPEPTFENEGKPAKNKLKKGQVKKITTA